MHALDLCASAKTNDFDQLGVNDNTPTTSDRAGKESLRHLMQMPAECTRSPPMLFAEDLRYSAGVLVERLRPT